MMNQQNPQQAITKLTCSQAEAQMVAYGHKALPAAEQEQMATHLASCNRCAQSLQELNLLEHGLRAEADGFRPQLSEPARQRIQQQLYRRMRLALVWQRFFNVVQTGFAVAAFAVAVIFALGFSYIWVQFLATADSDQQLIQGDNVVETAVFTPASATSPPPTAAPTLPPEQLVLPDEEPIFSIGAHPAYWDDLQTITPGQTPDEVALAVIEAAINQDVDRLNALFIAMSPTAAEPGRRLWQHFGRRCGGDVAPEEFTFSQSPLITDFPIVAITINHEGSQAGQIKLRQINGEWYPVYLQVGSVNECLLQTLK